MIRRDEGELVAECNECGTEFAGGTAEWAAFLADLKGEGWAFRKDDGEWQHFCPECVEVTQ